MKASPNPMGLLAKTLRLSLPGFQLRADFAIKPGERLGIAGPSGSGKSTLLRFLAGLPVPLVAPAEGEIILNQRTLYSGSLSTASRFGKSKPLAVPAHKRNLGVLLQDGGLFSEMNVWQNISFRLKLSGHTSTACQEAALSWLRKLKLQDLMNRSVDSLSGGERQRIALLRSWVGGPEALLLDEPFSALDESSRNALVEALELLLSESSIPLLIISHRKSDFGNLKTKIYSLQNQDVNAPKESLKSQLHDPLPVRYLRPNEE